MPLLILDICIPTSSQVIFEVRNNPHTKPQPTTLFFSTIALLPPCMPPTPTQLPPSPVSAHWHLQPHPLLFVCLPLWRKRCFHPRLRRSTIPEPGLTASIEFLHLFPNLTPHIPGNGQTVTRNTPITYIPPASGKRFLSIFYCDLHPLSYSPPVSSAKDPPHHVYPWD